MWLTPAPRCVQLVGLVLENCSCQSHDLSLSQVTCKSFWIVLQTYCISIKWAYACQQSILLQTGLMQIGIAAGSFSQRSRFEFLLTTLLSPKLREQGRTPHVRNMDVHNLLALPGMGWVFGSPAGQESVAPVAPFLGAWGQPTLWLQGDQIQVGKENEWPGWHKPLNKHLSPPAVPSLGWLVQPWVGLTGHSPVLRTTKCEEQLYHFPNLCICKPLVAHFNRLRSPTGTAGTAGQVVVRRPNMS